MSEALDLSALEEVFGDDRAGIVELVEMITGEEAGALAPVRSAVESHDAGALRDAAHGLKGAAANVGAFGVSHIAAELESRARSGVWDDVAGLLRDLGVALERARTELAAYRGAVT